MSLVCQLVTRPDSSAQVLADFASLSGGFTLSGETGKLDLGNPGFTSSPDAMQETTREIKLPLVFTGTPAACQAATSQVAQALSRADMWLRWQTSSASPIVYFRLIRDGNLGNLDWSNALPTAVDGTQTAWAWDVTLQAHGLAYGELAQLGTYTLGGGTLTVALDAVKGDAPAPAILDFLPTASASSMSGFRSLVNICSVDQSFLSTFNAGSLNFAMTDWASYSGSLAGPAAVKAWPNPGTGGGSYSKSGNTVIVPASASAPFNVINGNMPISPVPGTYRVYVRVGRSGTMGQCSLDFSPIANGWALWQPASSSFNPADSNSANAVSWVDCGTMQFPPGIDTRGMQPGQSFTHPPAVLRFTPSPNTNERQDLILDAVVLIPQRLSMGGESTTLTAQFVNNSQPDTSKAFRIDGDFKRVGLSQGNIVNPVTPPIVTGGFPKLTPGLNNFLTFVQNVNVNASGGEWEPMTFTTTVSYRPRYMHIGN